MNCSEAVAAFVASLESGTPMTDEQRQHIVTCERCRELLDSAKEFQSLLGGNGIEPPEVEPAVAAAQREVKRSRRIRFVLIAIATAVVIWVAASLIAYRVGDAPPVEAMLSGVIAAVVAMLVSGFIIVPVAAAFWFARGERSSSAPIYKRLKPGRQVSGVCLGLSERFGWNLTLVRLAFVIAFFFDGLGFWAYVILDLAMPIHPDDREHLLRFRIRRWWEARMSRA
ncbi:MAG: PspC domain-containing protein [Thermoanaerobaculia bacterium]